MSAPLRMPPTLPEEEPQAWPTPPRSENLLTFCVPAHKLGHKASLWEPPRTKTVWTKVTTRSFDEALASALQALHEQATQTAVLREVEALKTRVADLERQAGLSIPIETLAPAELVVTRPFHVTVCLDEDDGYRAMFTDANLMAFGDTEAEAVWNLKDLIALTFERLCELPPEKLGPGPTKQLAVLKSFIAPRP